jgi:hypothetical protein
MKSRKTTKTDSDMCVPPSIKYQQVKEKIAHMPYTLPLAGFAATVKNKILIYRSVAMSSKTKRIYMKHSYSLAIVLGIIIAHDLLYSIGIAFRISD